MCLPERRPGTSHPCSHGYNACLLLSSLFPVNPRAGKGSGNAESLNKCANRASEMGERCFLQVLVLGDAAGRGHAQGAKTSVPITHSGPLLSHPKRFPTLLPPPPAPQPGVLRAQRLQPLHPRHQRSSSPPTPSCRRAIGLRSSHVEALRGAEGVKPGPCSALWVVEPRRSAGQRPPPLQGPHPAATTRPRRPALLRPPAAPRLSTSCPAAPVARVGVSPGETTGRRDGVGGRRSGSNPSSAAAWLAAASQARAPRAGRENRQWAPGKRPLPAASRPRCSRPRCSALSPAFRKDLSSCAPSPPAPQASPNRSLERPRRPPSARGAPAWKDLGRPGPSLPGASSPLPRPPAAG